MKLSPIFKTATMIIGLSEADLNEIENIIADANMTEKEKTKKVAGIVRPSYESFVKTGGADFIAFQAGNMYENFAPLAPMLILQMAQNLDFDVTVSSAKKSQLRDPKNQKDVEFISEHLYNKVKELSEDAFIAKTNKIWSRVPAPVKAVLDDAMGKEVDFEKLARKHHQYVSTHSVDDLLNRFQALSDNLPEDAMNDFVETFINNVTPIRIAGITQDFTSSVSAKDVSNLTRAAIIAGLDFTKALETNDEDYLNKTDSYKKLGEAASKIVTSAFNAIKAGEIIPDTTNLYAALRAMPPFYPEETPSTQAPKARKPRAPRKPKGPAPE